jgi:hypothetical protein
MQTLPSLILTHVVVGYEHRPYQRGASGFRDSGNRDACVPLLSCLSKCRNPKGTNSLSHLTMPCIKTWHPTFQSFAYWVFVVGEDEGFIPFGFPGAETPKTKSTCVSHIRISQVGNSGLACTRDLLLDILGAEIPRHQDLSTLLLFQGYASRGFVICADRRSLTYVSREPKPLRLYSSLSSFRGFSSQDFATGKYKGTDPWVSCVPKHRNIQTLDALCCFGVSQVRISGLASTRDLSLDISSAETPYLIHGIIISGSCKSGFGDWRLQENLPVGIPGAETPKHPNSRHAMPFRGFANRDLGIGEYKRLAFRYPGFRNNETPYLIRAIIISGFRKSGFRDW